MPSIPATYHHQLFPSRFAPHLDFDYSQFLQWFCLNLWEKVRPEVTNQPLDPQHLIKQQKEAIRIGPLPPQNCCRKLHILAVLSFSLPLANHLAPDFSRNFINKFSSLQSITKALLNTKTCSTFNLQKHLLEVSFASNFGGITWHQNC